MSLTLPPPPKFWSADWANQWKRLIESAFRGQASGAVSSAASLGNVTVQSLNATDGITIGGDSIRTLKYVNTSVPSGNTIANNAAETAFASKYTIAANTLTVGDVLRIRARGTLRTPAAGGTLVFRLKYGTFTLLANAAYTLPAGAIDTGWELEGTAVITAIGASGTAEAHGKLIVSSVATANAVGGATTMLSNTAAISIVTDHSADVQLTADWDSATSTRSVTMRQFIVERLRA